MKPHFGKWLEKIRNKLEIDQRQMARWLKLKSYQAVYHIEHKAERSMRGKTLEGLLELLGYENAEELDAAWRAGRMPDLAAVRKRIGAADNERPALPANRGIELRWIAVMLEGTGVTVPDWLELFDLWLARQPKIWKQLLVKEVATMMSDAQIIQAKLRGVAHAREDPAANERLSALGFQPRGQREER